jgi:hypothetical protein
MLFHDAYKLLIEVVCDKVIPTFQTDIHVEVCTQTEVKFSDQLLSPLFKKSLSTESEHVNSQKPHEDMFLQDI